MDNNKEKMKFIRTDNAETAMKLRYAGYTELPAQSRGMYCFLNDGKKLTFNAEENGIVFSNILCL